MRQEGQRHWAVFLSDKVFCVNSLRLHMGSFGIFIATMVVFNNKIDKIASSQGTLDLGKSELWSQIATKKHAKR